MTVVRVTWPHNWPIALQFDKPSTWSSNGYSSSISLRAVAANDSVQKSRRSKHHFEDEDLSINNGLRILVPEKRLSQIVLVVTSSKQRRWYSTSNLRLIIQYGCHKPDSYSCDHNQIYIFINNPYGGRHFWPWCFRHLFFYEQLTRHPWIGFYCLEESYYDKMYWRLVVSTCIELPFWVESANKAFLMLVARRSADRKIVRTKKAIELVFILFRSSSSLSIFKRHFKFSINVGAAVVTTASSSISRIPQ